LQLKFKFHSVLDGKPMQIEQYWSDVIRFTGVKTQPSSNVLNSLRTLE